MTRRKTSDGSSTSKMTVMLFQLEGDDATLQEGIRTISNAMSRVLPGGTVQGAVPALHFSPALSSPESHENGDEYDEAETIVNSPSNGSRKRRRRSPQVLDVDLTTGDMPLKAHLDKYSGDHDSKRYLLIAYWFKHHCETEEVTMDHIHTGYRHMGWQTPRDAAQPLRDMKSKQEWFHKGDDRGSYKINHIGENEVNNIMKEGE